MAPNQKRTLLASRKLQPINGRPPPTACMARVSMRLSWRSRNEALRRRHLRLPRCAFCPWKCSKPSKTKLVLSSQPRDSSDSIHCSDNHSKRPRKHSKAGSNDPAHTRQRSLSVRPTRDPACWVACLWSPVFYEIYTKSFSRIIKFRSLLQAWRLLVWPAALLG